MSYAVNTDTARQGDSNSTRLTETGAYVGIFIKAEEVTSTKGTQGIEFTFQTPDKSTADYLTLWTINTDGKELFGLKQLNAMMVCMRIRTAIAPTPGIVEKYEKGGKAKVKVEAQLFKDLMNKQIGVLLQKEGYEKNDRSIGSRLNLAGFFEASSRMTAIEILDKAVKPERLDRMIATLKDKPFYKSGKPAQSENPGHGMPEDAEDDSPY